MRLLGTTLLIWTVGSLAAIEDEPWASDKALVSPSRSFTIVQQRDADWFTTTQPYLVAMTNSTATAPVAI